MDIERKKAEFPKKISSAEIGKGLEAKLGLGEGSKIMIKQIRGGQIEFSILAEDAEKLKDYFTTVPGYREGFHLKDIQNDGKYIKIKTEAQFRLRLLADLYLKDKEKAATIQVADLTDKLSGIKAEHSQIKYLREVFQGFEWDPSLFKMLHEESLLCSQVRKLVQAHTILCLGAESDLFKPSAAETLPIEEKVGGSDDSPHCALRVLPDDCLKAAAQLDKDGYKVCVLNMANQFTPGGGYGHGAGAQEEDLCRRTDLLKSLPGHYENDIGFGEFNVLYSKGVTVFRGGQNEGYPVYKPEQRFTVDVVSSAAYNLSNPEKPSYKDPNSPDYAEGMKRKIRGQLRAADAKGNNALVLSAFGCGAFRNDSKRVAQFYLEVLSETEFRGVFKVVEFAIVPNPSEPNNSNYDNFNEVLQGKGLSLENLSVSDVVYN